jgi:hypothetical protein
VTSTDIKGPDDDDYVMCDVRTVWENVRMPATKETQCSNGMQNIIFNSDKTIWDTGGQQINNAPVDRGVGGYNKNRRRWQGQRSQGDVCAGGLGFGWRGLYAGGTDNGRRWHGKWR